MKKLFIALLLFVLMTPAYADSVKLSDDGTCLIQETNGNVKANCTWYLVNLGHYLDAWYPVVNEEIRKEIRRIRADQTRRDASVRAANRNRINLIHKAK